MSGTQLLPAEQIRLPLLPLRDVVVFPHMVIPLFVGRPKSIKALEAAMEAGKSIMLVAQKTAAKDEPTDKDLYEVGCIANILQMLKLPDGTVKVLVEGTQRANILSVTDDESHFHCEAMPIGPEPTESAETEALRRAIVSQFDQYVKLNKKIPPEILTSLSGIDEPGRLADTIAAHLPIKLEQKQKILEMFNVTERLESLLSQLEGEIDILQVEKRIRGRVKRQMEKSQREYYLNEQVKAIQKELGEGEEGADLEELDKKIKAARMPKEAKKKADAEFKKLKLMSPMSAEATVVRNYIDTLVGLPWRKKSKVNNDLSNAEQVLDQDHYGLEKVKERILEYLAVQQRVDKVKAPILCLVGPPGVGKTSLGQSVARATNRKFVRMALGGVRDEAEIRGHRRTYIGSMPGKILQSLTKVGVRNPLFLLDEIDKMGMDFRGDPSSALLEVLDPEQNHTFQDHYIEVDFDLSDVMFVATSNSLNIPAPLLDRMEVIRLSGYTEDEKVNIAQRYLLPKQTKNNGLKDGELEVAEGALRDIIRYYTREAGVRSLEREISKICRKVVKQLLLKKEGATSVKVDSDNLDKFLGVRRFDFGLAGKEDQVGQVTGLAWTEVGGDLLTIEAAVMPGKGNITRTGSLGDVMKESVEAARSVVRSRSARLGVKDELFEKRDIHIHVPEGATPKDGPSAGIAMTTALVSVLTGIPVRADVAMTGEITLRGEVLPIGGLKEKLLAAHRGGIKLVLIPEENVKDLADIPDNVKNSIEIVPVRWIDKVLELALVRKPEPLPEEEPKPAPEAGKTEGGDVHEMVHH
ncbi:endopeptidase La [Ralstonia syzygii subsp. celebesensis]|uniref:Lon protease n=4 Tax=Ralstonia solanacearum species complex TaxID=3116862 RepID=A0AAD0S6H1_RALSL|nr:MULTISPECIES: endopeptidase La [Ralstonia solanacearum species complex]CCA79881.1 DNA-binding ATP-dependent protease [blood disease bacterium R229]BEU72018.1 endopeptidase La [Ralstonia pseudosolanacearum]AMP37538.1 endopeptidase La [Ralstonia solanacearum]AQW29504.1 endopeptidase La [blood disease bacterium A2-HR MARDI]AXV76926.1 endopeptidase La [Ralstonia solanacearum]